MIAQSEEAIVDALPLTAGMRLTQAEFHARYHTMPDESKWELIEGEARPMSPAGDELHGEPHGELATWLGTYRRWTQGVRMNVESTLILDGGNEYQPDVALRYGPERGGNARLVGRYLHGAPELIAEVAASSSRLDLGEKFAVYERCGVREYIVWRTRDGEVDWFVLQAGRYEPLLADADGITRSRAFPGLWLDRTALVRGESRRLLAVEELGRASAEYAAFAVAETEGQP